MTRRGITTIHRDPRVDRLRTRRRDYTTRRFVSEDGLPSFHYSLPNPRRPSKRREFVGPLFLPTCLSPFYLPQPTPCHVLTVMSNILSPITALTPVYNRSLMDSFPPFLTTYPVKSLRDLCFKMFQLKTLFPKGINSTPKTVSWEVRDYSVSRSKVTDDGRTHFYGHVLSQVRPPPNVSEHPSRLRLLDSSWITVCNG